ncbi:hypothetical protein CERSUDRAFT_98340 [Gelatoporia subvermispora B]|uniref:Uncharacterized protein n=1 Tax=Ceriporiopsis subvermispora (strain B) TaxID=914234 RepID=M2QNQ3_CERS8|nr:hypothetical protein CERSUDRAFT_98340 [Gelatoporia subvermispora B]
MFFDFAPCCSAAAYYTPPNAGEYNDLSEVYMTLEIVSQAPGGQSEPPIFPAPAYDIALDDGFGLEELGIEKVAPSQPEWAPFGEHAGNGIHGGLHGDGSGEQQSLFALDPFPSFEPMDTLSAPAYTRDAHPHGFDTGMESIGGVPIASLLRDQRAPLPPPQYGGSQVFLPPDPFTIQPTVPTPVATLNAGSVLPGVQYHDGVMPSQSIEDSSYSSSIAPYAIDSSPADLANHAAAGHFEKLPLENYPYVGRGQMSQDPTHTGSPNPVQFTMSDYQQPIIFPQLPMLESPQHEQSSSWTSQAVPHIIKTLNHGTTDFDLPCSAFSAQVSAPPLLSTATENVCTSNRGTGEDCAEIEAESEAPPKRKRSRRQRQASAQRAGQTSRTEAQTLASGGCSASPVISASSSSTTGLSTGTGGSCVASSAALVSDDTLDEGVKRAKTPCVRALHGTQEKVRQVFRNRAMLVMFSGWRTLPGSR